MNSIILFEQELAIEWKNQQTSIIPYLYLRQFCPCAMCSGETDVMGNKYGGGKIKVSEDIKIIKYLRVGHYGLQFFFSDVRWALVLSLSIGRVSNTMI